MPLTGQSRSATYQGLIVIVEDEQAVQEMLSYFPSRDGDESATEESVRVGLALTTGDLRNEMSAMGADLRHEMAAQGSDLRLEIQGLRVEMHELFRRQTVWTVTTLLACMSIQTALLALALR